MSWVRCACGCSRRKVRVVSVNLKIATRIPHPTRLHSLSHHMASLIFEGGSGSPTKPTSRPTLTRQLTGTADDSRDSIMGNTEEEDIHRQSQQGFEDQKGADTTHSANSHLNNSTTYQSSVQTPLHLKFNMGGIKDEGVKGKENQDDYFLWNKGDGKTYVIAVLDGHGRELGKLASKAAKDSIYRDLTSDAMLNQLRTTPQETMTQVFARANDAIRTVSSTMKKTMCSVLLGSPTNSPPQKKS